MQITMSQSLYFLVIIVVATVSLLDAVPVSQTHISSVSESHQNTLSDELSDQDGLTPLKSSDEGKELVRDKRTIGFLRTLFPGLSQPSETENQVTESKASAEINVRSARKRRQAAEAAKPAESSSAAPDTDKDLDTNETSSNDDTNADVDDNEEAPTEDDGRNKRFLNFGGSGAGGSGNFLFDIIRLIAGSGTTQEKDEEQNAPVDSDNAAAAQSTPKDDGYSAGVPGPLTRLFVIANRGIANLIQDLILRLAQTSERIVNFKARLITSII